jgi:hypothetical protein
MFHEPHSKTLRVKVDNIRGAESDNGVVHEDELEGAGLHEDVDKPDTGVDRAGEGTRGDDSAAGETVL